MTRWHISPYTHPEWLQWHSGPVIFWVSTSDPHCWLSSHKVNLSLCDVYKWSVKQLVMMSGKRQRLSLTYHSFSDNPKWAILLSLKVATVIFKHHPWQNLPPVKQQSPISDIIHHLIICNVLETQYLPPHKEPSSISHRIFSSYGNTCDVRENLLVLETSLTTAWYTYTRNHLVHRMLPKTRYKVLYK